MNFSDSPQRFCPLPLESLYPRPLVFFARLAGCRKILPKVLQASFRRKPESRTSSVNWTPGLHKSGDPARRVSGGPASAGVTSKETLIHFFGSLLALIVFSVVLRPGILQAFNAHHPFDISSDVLEYNDETQELTAEGHVVVLQGSSTLHADLVIYDRLHNRLLGRGNVFLRDQGSVLAGNQLAYDLTLQKGEMTDGKGYGSPWYFQGARWEKNLDYYLGRQASFTSCDLIDPHYHVRSSRVHLIPDRFFWAWDNRFYIDETPIFYSPFMYKSFEPKRVVFQVEPGHDTVKGSFARTTTTVRIRDGIYDKVLLDFYTVSGTGFGNEFNYSRPDYKGSLFGYYIDPKGTPELIGAPKTEQYNIRSYHWQQVSPTLTFQSNVNHRKNVSFNNQFFTQDTNQSVTDINNSVALTHSSKKSTHRVLFKSLEAPDAGADPLYGETHIQEASLPRYEASFFQRPLWAPRVSTDTLEQVLHPHHVGALQLSGNGNLENSYSRIDDQTRWRANAAATFSLPVNLSRQWSLSTTLTPSLKWQDKYDPFVSTSTGAPVEIPSGYFRGYQGRLGGTGNLRYRPWSPITLDQNYNLTLRMEPNALALDRSLSDGGVETNHLRWLLYFRPSRQILLRSFSGYDLRSLEDEDPYQYSQRRVDPWTNELTIQRSGSPHSYFFRHQMGYYPTRSLLWEADARWKWPHNTSLQTGLSYNAGQAGYLTWNNTAAFYYSSSWRVEAILNSLIPNTRWGDLRYASLLQSQFVVTRNMHCWDIQFIYKNLPPVTREYSVLFNLRMGAQKAREKSDREFEAQFYPWRATD